MANRVGKVRRKVEGHYHHGDLRAALVKAAAQEVSRSGSVAFSLRDVATTAGVSHAAAYRHFASKSELLAAVAREGFTSLRLAMEGAVAGRAGTDAVIEAGAAYVAFAEAETGTFRTMFTPSLKPFTQFPGLDEAAWAALGVLQGAIVRAGLPTAATRELSLGCWGLVHGLAVLTVDGQLKGPFGLTTGVEAARAMLRRFIEAGGAPASVVAR